VFFEKLLESNQSEIRPGVITNYNTKKRSKYCNFG